MAISPENRIRQFVQKSQPTKRAAPHLGHHGVSKIGCSEAALLDGTECAPVDPKPRTGGELIANSCGTPLPLHPPLTRGASPVEDDLSGRLSLGPKPAVTDSFRCGPVCADSLPCPGWLLDLSLAGPS